MGDANELAYERANLIRNVSMFKNVQFLLVHGMSDGKKFWKGFFFFFLG